MEDAAGTQRMTACKSHSRPRCECPFVSMNNRRLLVRVVPILVAVIIVAMQFFSAEKTVNETGRAARVALSSDQESQLGLQSYQQVLAESQRIESGPEYETVRRVAGRLAQGTGDTGKKFDWAVSLVRDQQANAFCLPGGKIVVFAGILPIAKTEAGLATVMGHEMAHAVARHGSERLFKEQATQTLMRGVQVSMADMSYENQRWVMGVIGAGARYGFLMPWGRDQESEADHLGLLYMARAGYDPREAIAFWQRMEQNGGRAAPEWMSTHPSHGTRASQLEELMPKAVAEYERHKR